MDVVVSWWELVRLGEKILVDPSSVLVCTHSAVDLTTGEGEKVLPEKGDGRAGVGGRT